MPHAPRPRVQVRLAIAIALAATGAARAQGSIRVQTLTPSGNVSAGAVVSISGNGIMQAIATTSGTVVFQPLSPGTYTLTARSGAACGSASQTAAVTTTQVVVVFVVPDCPFDVLSISPAVDAIAVLDARANGSAPCVNDMNPVLRGT